MSLLTQAQLTSLPFKPTPMFTAFQTLGASTTLPAMPSNLTVPVAVAGGASANPVGVYDNRKPRATSLLLMFAATAANNVKIAFDVIGFSHIKNPADTSTTTKLYLPVKFFLGEAQAGNINVSTALAENTAFLCDNFSLKTFVGANVSYIEPADDIAGALLVCDIRGFDYIQIRLAQGAATAATKAQVWYGVN